jgi:hypothetical protein
MSAYSYAYRDDLTAHDAILHIQAELRGSQRLFMAEYDFSKYFDSISHDYIWSVLDANKFLISPLERTILQLFLETRLLESSSYVRHSPDATRKTTGLPQGTSVSLFLANVAAWELDRALERLGIGFARYADDTLIWSHDYGRICEAVDRLTTISHDIGADLNFKKSFGVSIFTPDRAPAEFKSKSSVDFVGYRFTHAAAGMRHGVAQRIKRRIAYLIWSNLLEPIERGTYVPGRIAAPIDRDYWVMLLQIRRYLYGNLTEAKLRKLRAGRAKEIHYPGVMSYFPLVDDLNQLKALDGWLLHTIYTSLRRRSNLLEGLGASSLPTPHGLSKKSLLNASGKTSSGARLDLQIPSFVRIATQIHRAAVAHGPNAVARGSGPFHYHY